MELTLNSNRKLLVESKTVYVIAADGVTSWLAFDSVLHRGHSQAGVLEILHPLQHEESQRQGESLSSVPPWFL